jgi:hypothetical protein
MKASEFRKLIREEVRRAINEADAVPAGGYKPIGLGLEMNLVGKTNDGKNFTGPYKLIPGFKVKLRILQQGGGSKIPDVNYLTIFRNQLIGKDLGRISISINVPWGPVDKMGKDILALIAKTYSQDTAKADRGTLSNAKELKKVLDQVLSEKWPALTDDAINNPKALRMMYGMGAAIERVAAVS